MVADLTNAEIPQGAAALFWLDELKKFPKAAIEWAFRDYLRHGVDDKGQQFMPKPGQIIQRCEAYMRTRRPDADKSEAERMRELREREANGEQFYTMADVLKDHPALKKLKNLSQMSEDEWEARKRAEQEKVQKFMQGRA